MTPNKPYLLRAFYEWIVDNQMTPYVLVDAFFPGVSVPQQYVQNGHILLNISPVACHGLTLDNDRIVFSARFSGQVEQIFIPPLAVLEIYAKENGRGISFPPEEDIPPPPPPTASPPDSPALGKKTTKASLKLVK
jgi:stringent starvation protein B